MRVWILQTGEPLHIDNPNLRPMRAMNLSNELASRGHEVLLISSDFDHFTKKHRKRFNENIFVKENLRIKLIPSLGYKKHIGISRLIDHFQLGMRLPRTIQSEVLPDVVFIGYPPIETAWRLSKWLTRRGIPYFVDVKDAWPEIFVSKFPKQLQIIAKFLLLPYFLCSNYVFQSASGITGPSEQYLKWGISKAKRKMGEHDFVTPLTSPISTPTDGEILAAQEFWKTKGVFETSKPKIYFVGSLTDSFDFNPLIRLAETKKYQVIIAGSGPHEDNFRRLSSNIPDLIIPGWINQTQLYVLASLCKFSIIPLINRFDFDMNVTNKFVDSLRLGKPILSSNLSLVKNYIKPRNVGEGFQSDNLKETIDRLLNDLDGYRNMEKNAIRTYLDHFDFKTKYGELINHLEKSTK